jgi:hypothetical protein
VQPVGLAFKLASQRGIGLCEGEETSWKLVLGESETHPTAGGRATGDVKLERQAGSLSHIGRSLIVHSTSILLSMKRFGPRK